MLFCGIDLHSNNCFVVIADDDDKVLYSRRLPNNLAEICAALSPYRAELSGVVVESTYNWYWLVDGLINVGYSLHLANTTAISNTMVSSTGAMSPIPGIWHTFCVLVCCLRVTSCPNLYVPFETWPVNVFNWCSSERLRSSRFRPAWPNKPVDAFRVTTSSN